MFQQKSESVNSNSFTVFGLKHFFPFRSCISNIGASVSNGHIFTMLLGNQLSSPKQYVHVGIFHITYKHTGFLSPLALIHYIAARYVWVSTIIIGWMVYVCYLLSMIEECFMNVCVLFVWIKNQTWILSFKF